MIVGSLVNSFLHHIFLGSEQGSLMKFSVLEAVKLIDLERSIVMLHHQIQFVISIKFLKAKKK